MTILYIFITSFLLNLVWENLHAPLYTKHLKHKITEKVLVVATVGDAVILTVLGALFMYTPYLEERVWMIVPIGLILAVLIEWAALYTKRWSYGKNMPIILVVNVGLTPTIQLALTGYITFI